MSILISKEFSSNFKGKTSNIIILKRICTHHQCLLKDCTMEFDTVLNLLVHSQTGTYDETVPG